MVHVIIGLLVLLAALLVGFTVGGLRILWHEDEAMVSASFEHC